MTLTETTAPADARETYARRIRKMLDLAENAGTEAEAETFREKAYELMEKYAVTDAMLNEHRQEERDELVTETFTFRGRFARANLDMAWYIASAFGMRGIQRDYTDRWITDKRMELALHGWKSDMERFKLLLASLQIQAVRAQQEWERRTGLRTSDRPQWDKFKARRAFLSGFGSGVGTKLRAAQRKAEAEVARERADAGLAATVEEATTGVALVLRDRKETVDDWFDSTYGKLRSARSVSHRGAYGAQNAGYQAGQKADTGQNRVGGTRRAIR